MAASDTASLDKKLESLPLPVLQQIVARHSIVLSEADLRDTVRRYLPNIKNEEEGAVVICRGFEVGADEDCADETVPHPRGGWVEAELCEDARLLGDDEFVSVEVQFRDETRSLSVRRRVVRFVGSASRTAVSSARQPVEADLASLPRWVGNRSADGFVGQCLEAFLGSLERPYEWQGSQTALGLAVRRWAAGERWPDATSDEQGGSLCASPVPWLDDDALWERARRLGRLEGGAQFSVEIVAGVGTFRAATQYCAGVSLLADESAAAARTPGESRLGGHAALCNLCTSTRFSSLARPARYEVLERTLAEAIAAIDRGEEPKPDEKPRGLKRDDRSQADEMSLIHDGGGSDGIGVNVMLRHSVPVSPRKPGQPASKAGVLSVMALWQLLHPSACGLAMSMGLPQLPLFGGRSFMAAVQMLWLRSRCMLYLQTHAPCCGMESVCVR